MTETVAQQALLPGLLTAAGLTGQEGRVAAGGRGRGALNSAPGLGGQAFQQQLQALLAGESEAPGAARLLPATVPVAAARLSELPAAEPLADAGKAADFNPLLADGRSLPESGNILPPVPQLLRDIAAPAVLPPAATQAQAQTQTQAGEAALAAAAPARPALGGESQPAAAAQDAALKLTGTLPDEQPVARPVNAPADAVEQALTRPPDIQKAAVAPLAEQVLQLSKSQGASKAAAQQPVTPLPIDPDMPLPQGDAMRRWLDLNTRAAPRAHPPVDHMPGLAAGAARGTEVFSLPLTLLSGAENPLRDLHNLPTLKLQSGDAGQQAWSAGLGQRLLMMAENGVEVARLRLTPAHLGPLEIHVNVEDDRAQVWFGAQHSQTREALESALPRLREMFAAQGLELTQADVENHGEQAAERDTGRQPAAADRLAADAAGRVDFVLPAAGPAGSARGFDIYV